MWFAFTGWPHLALPFNIVASRTVPVVRTLVIALIVMALVAVAGGQLLEARATDRVAARLASSTDEVQGVDVELAGFPVAFRAAAGRVPEVVVEIDQLTTRDPEVTFAPVVLDLRDVRFGAVDLVLGRSQVVRVGDGSATATLPAVQLSRLAAKQGPGWDLTVQDGRLVATGDVEGSTARVVAGLEIAEGALRLTAREVAVEGEVPAAVVARAFDRAVSLPELPGRIRLTEVEVGTGGVVLRGVVRGPLDLSA